MWFLYQFLRGLTIASLTVFYRKMVRIGWENTDFSGPLIVVANHPSTLMDPLHVAAWVPRRVHFLANYSLFKNPISNFLLRRLWCFPVKRRQDVAENEPLDNLAVLSAVDDFLGKTGGCLFMCPEGSSFMNREIRPLRTGAARIAFSAESKNGWQLGLRILPVGLIYSAPNEFQSTVWKTMGEPIRVADWRVSFERNAFDAVNELTDFVENSLKSLTFLAQNEADEIFQRHLETVFVNEKQPGPVAHFQEFQKTWQAVSSSPAAENADLQKRAADYFEALAAAKLTDRGLADISKKRGLAGDAVFLAAAAPLASVGAAAWFLPCVLPWFLVKRLRLYIGYDSNVKFLAGVFFTVPLMFFGVFKLARYFELTGWQSMACVVLTLPVGWLAWRWWLVAERLFENLQAVFFAEKNGSFLEKMEAARREIFQKMTAR